MDNPLAKVLLPVVVIAVILLRFGRRRESREEIGLRSPEWRWVPLWAALSLLYMFGTNWFMYWRGSWDFEPWRHATLLHNALRLLAIVILGPISEELICRGVIQGRLARIMPIAAAIAITAVVFSMIHLQYKLPVRFMFVGWALLLGIARVQTKSVVTPIIMHILWNAYAIW